MTIPLVDLIAQYEQIKPEVTAAIQEVLAKGQFVLGEEVDRFEQQFARYNQAKHCVAVANGTDALHLTLRALDIGPGDEVITAANTFAATAFAISYTGATPVFIDVRRSDYTIDVELLEQAISPRTKAIVPVHLYGHPADLDGILALSHRYGLKVVEDACQAHGAQYRGLPVGSIGHAGCFSFYPGKNLGAYGDGGAVVTDDDRLADRIRLLRNHAQHVKGVHLSVGFNSRLDTLQAAILLVKLRSLDAWNRQRRTAARRYAELLGGVDVGLPSEAPGVRHVYHLYVIQSDRRDELLRCLRDQDIGAAVHYPVPLNAQEPYRAARTIPQGAPVATSLSRTILSLPMFPEIAHQHISTVAEAIRSFHEQLPGRCPPRRIPASHVS